MRRTERSKFAVATFLSLAICSAGASVVGAAVVGEGGGGGGEAGLSQEVMEEERKHFKKIANSLSLLQVGGHSRYQSQ